MFAKLILAGDFEEAVSVARQQVEGGAQIIDVNMDEGMLDSEQAMDERFCSLIAGGAGHRARAGHGRQLEVVESSKRASKCVQGKGIVNSISLKEGEEKFIAQAQARFAATARRSS